MMYYQKILPRSKAHPTPECPTVHKDFMLKIIRGILIACNEGKQTVSVKNPCIAFTKEAKAGTYDSITDAEYNSILADVEWVSANLWKGQLQENYENLFYNLRSLSPLSLKASVQIASVIRSSLMEAGAVSCSADPMPDLHYALFMEEQHNEPESIFYKDDLSRKEASEPVSNLTPHQICSRLSDSIYGQNEAKKAASMLVWNHIHGRKRNLLTAGPSGCGKTALWEAMKQIYPYIIIIIDGTRITKEGWKGSFKMNNIFDSFTASDAERSIVVIDEADKFFEPQTDSDHENVSYQLQSELLKLMEGTQLTGSDHQIIDTSHVSFVFLGSFQHLQKKKLEAAEEQLKHGYLKDADNLLSHDEITTQDLISFAGVRQEVAGRLDSIITMNPMKAEDFLQILNTPSMSPLSFLEKQYGVTLFLPEREKRELSQKAADSHLGVRYLRSSLRHQLDILLFDHPDQKEYLLYPEA